MRTRLQVEFRGRSSFGNCTSLRPDHDQRGSVAGGGSQFLRELHFIEAPVSMRRLGARRPMVAVPSGTALH